MSTNIWFFHEERDMPEINPQITRKTICDAEKK